MASSAVFHCQRRVVRGVVTCGVRSVLMGFGVDWFCELKFGLSGLLLNVEERNSGDGGYLVRWVTFHYVSKGAWGSWERSQCTGHVRVISK